MIRSCLKSNREKGKSKVAFEGVESDGQIEFTEVEEKDLS